MQDSDTVNNSSMPSRHGPAWREVAGSGPVLASTVQIGPARPGQHVGPRPSRVTTTHFDGALTVSSPARPGPAATQRHAPVAPARGPLHQPSPLAPVRRQVPGILLTSDGQHAPARLPLGALLAHGGVGVVARLSPPPRLAHPHAHASPRLAHAGVSSASTAPRRAACALASSPSASRSTTQLARPGWRRWRGSPAGGAARGGRQRQRQRRSPPSPPLRIEHMS